MAFQLYTLLAILTVAAVSSTAMPTSGSFTGAGTYSPGAMNGWACQGRAKPAKGLPQVAINAAQFGMGAACGACIKVTGTGEGQGKTPLTGTFMVTVTNILTQGAVGDLDFPRDGDGKWGIKWSFVKCPGTISTSRRMLELEA